MGHERYLSTCELHHDIQHTDNLSTSMCLTPCSRYTRLLLTFVATGLTRGRGPIATLATDLTASLGNDLICVIGFAALFPPTSKYLACNRQYILFGSINLFVADSATQHATKRHESVWADLATSLAKVFWQRWPGINADKMIMCILRRTQSVRIGKNISKIAQWPIPHNLHGRWKRKRYLTFISPRWATQIST